MVSMNASLPSLRPSGASSSSKKDSSDLPCKPSVTKAEKYQDLVRFDRYRLKRQEAHFRNALKTTSGLEAVAKNLDRVNSK